jgi:hypothetical protein
LPNLLLLRQENREALFSQDGGGAWPRTVS